MNLGELRYYSGERDFMNLTKSDNWRISRQNVLGEPADGQISDEGVVKWLNPGETGILYLNWPTYTGAASVEMRCTFVGTGKLVPSGMGPVRQLDHAAEFTWTFKGYARSNVWLTLESTDPSDPVRQIDCREADADKRKVFADEFLNSLRPFGVIRFLGWQDTNISQETSWASRTLPARFNRGGGASVEDMVELSNELNADPWFQIPWSANEEYITKFAQYVHDNLRPGRRAYIELSNEVWNYQFRDTNIAQSEGLAAGLSTNSFQALLRRYAQKSKWALGIWSRVYEDKPQAIVRVVATQHANSWTAEQVLGFEDTANYVDALATAPYFSIKPDAASGVDGLLTALQANADEQIEQAKKNKAVAAQYGKRHITYEGGQHLVWDDVALNALVQRDPRMEDVYAHYLKRWRAEVGDLITLLSATSPISKYGAWGIREFSGQPLSETPKRRAILAAAENTK